MVLAVRALLDGLVLDNERLGPGADVDLVEVVVDGIAVVEPDNDLLGEVLGNFLDSGRDAVHRRQVLDLFGLHVRRINTPVLVPTLVLREQNVLGGEGPGVLADAAVVVIRDRRGLGNVLRRPDPNIHHAVHRRKVRDVLAVGRDPRLRLVRVSKEHRSRNQRHTLAHINLGPLVRGRHRHDLRPNLARLRRRNLGGRHRTRHGELGRRLGRGNLAERGHRKQRDDKEREGAEIAHHRGGPLGVVPSVVNRIFLGWNNSRLRIRRGLSPIWAVRRAPRPNLACAEL